MNGNHVTYFDSIGFEHVPTEIKKLIHNKYITINIYNIQANDSVMCRYFCIGFIHFILKDKSLLHYTKLFLPNQYGKHGKIFSITKNLFY